MGRVAGVGIEDRRADGCAVRFFAGARRAMGVFSAAVALTVFSSACTRHPAEIAPDPVTLLQAVPAADAARLERLQQSKQEKSGQQESGHWRNPYLVVRPEKVGLLTGVAANEEQILKPEEVVKALAQLPASAWPYGRAVAILVDEKAANSEADKVALRRNRGIVAGELENAHVVIQWIPSS